jgi:hypothetical protein
MNDDDEFQISLIKRCNIKEVRKPGAVAHKNVKRRIQ